MIYFITLSVVSFFLAVTLLVALVGLIRWVKRELEESEE